MLQVIMHDNTNNYVISSFTMRAHKSKKVEWIVAYVQSIYYGVLLWEQPRMLQVLMHDITNNYVIS